MPYTTRERTLLREAQKHMWKELHLLSEIYTSGLRELTPRERRRADNILNRLQELKEEGEPIPSHSDL